MVENKKQVFISLVAYIDQLDTTILEKQYNFIDNNFTEFQIILVSENNKISNEIQDFLKEQDHIKVTLINTTKNTGLENSLKAGIDFSIGDLVITLHTMNFNLDNNDILRAYNELAQGYDIISLSPNNSSISSQSYYKIMNYMGVENKMYTEIATLLTRRAINKLNKFNFSTMYRKALYGSLGYQHKYINVNVDYQSDDKLHTKINAGFEYALTYSKLGTKISLYLSLICLFASIFIGGYALFIKLFVGNIALGWTTTMIFLSFGFSGIFAILMILCKYLEIMIKNTLFKSEYKISSIDNFS